MSYSKSEGITIVQDRRRDTSVGSYNSSASRSSWASNYSSPSSGGGSVGGSSSNASHGSARYRDPYARDNIVDVRETTDRRGDVITTINHKKPNPSYNEPTPSYGASSRYKIDRSDRERR